MPRRARTQGSRFAALFTTAVLGAAFLIACSGSGSAVSTCTSSPQAVTEPGSIASASLSKGCEGATTIVQWTDQRSAGTACTDPTQCHPTCCACGTAGRSALTSWCNHGICASAADVCCALAGTTTNSCGQ